MRECVFKRKTNLCVPLPIGGSTISVVSVCSNLAYLSVQNAGDLCDKLEHTHFVYFTMDMNLKYDTKVSSWIILTDAMLLTNSVHMFTSCLHQCIFYTLTRSPVNSWSGVQRAVGGFSIEKLQKSRHQVYVLAEHRVKQWFFVETQESNTFFCFSSLVLRFNASKCPKSHAHYSSHRQSVFVWLKFFAKSWINVVNSRYHELTKTCEFKRTKCINLNWIVKQLLYIWHWMLAKEPKYVNRYLNEWKMHDRYISHFISVP